MPKLFIPVGMPGCGKSTFASKVLANGDSRVISTDLIRREVHPGVQHDASRNPEIFQRYHDRIQHHLTRGHDTVADATNLRKFAREHLREIAAQTGASTHILLFTNAAQAIRRNQGREWEVPAPEMFKFVDQLEEALKDIPNESYTTVTQISEVY